MKETFEQQFVILANSQNEINALFSSGDFVGTEKNELLNRLIFENPNKWNATSSSDFRAFPMWGETAEPGIIITDATKRIEGIKVLRAIARVDVVLSKEAEKNFKLTEVYIYNTKTRGYIVPDPLNLASNIQVTKAQVSSGTATMPHNDYDPSDPNAKALIYPIPDVRSKLFEREIYLLEAEAKANDKRNEATCLVIGGQYNGSNETTWYRADFIEKVSGAGGEIQDKFIDIRRNHQYRFSINSVGGPGHPEPEIAFKEKTINMEAEIKVWDDGNVGDIYFDGQNYISINPGIELNFLKDASSKVDTIKTDVVAGFKITGITYEEGSSPVGSR